MDRLLVHSFSSPLPKICHLQVFLLLLDDHMVKNQFTHTLLAHWLFIAELL